jgi:ribose/xylose/arabinose/galactoside ABC-type transport system permease subunit
MTSKVHTRLGIIKLRSQQVFVRVGVLPFLLLAAIVVFTSLSGNFLTHQNLLNVARQTTYLSIVAMGQMLVLLTGGFDLSVGKNVAITSVSSAMIMAAAARLYPDYPGVSIAVGMLAGIAVGTLVGIFNGIGVAFFEVSPFMMTLGTASICFGIALTLTSGVPVYGMPDAFSEIFGVGNLFAIPTPVYVVVALFVALDVLLSWTPMGRYIYAIGGNPKASLLSGIPTRLYFLIAYVLGGFFSAVAGVMLTARLETGEANIGTSLPLDSITACVIGGVSLKGGAGKLGNVVLGAIFIGLVQNGMDLAHVQSYLQEVAIGALLIIAVIADQQRHRMVLALLE